MYSPVPMKRSSNYGSNYWEVYSPKLERIVKQFSDLEYDNWVLIETDSSIETFCEQPVIITDFYDGKQVKSIIDLWVKYKDGNECFMEVKYLKDLDPFNPRAARSIRQTYIQKKWCFERNLSYIIRTEIDIRRNKIHLENMKTIIPYARGIGSEIETDRLRIFKLINSSKMSLASLEAHLPTIPKQRIRTVVFQLIYLAKIQSNMDKVPISNVTEVWV